MSYPLKSFCPCGCEGERLPAVNYWIEGRKEYPGGAFSHWGVGPAFLSLTGALNLVKRYRESAGPFAQLRIRGAAPSIPYVLKF